MANLEISGLPKDSIQMPSQDGGVIHLGAATYPSLIISEHASEEIDDDSEIMYIRGEFTEDGMIVLDIPKDGA